MGRTGVYAVNPHHYRLGTPVRRVSEFSFRKIFIE